MSPKNKTIKLHGKLYDADSGRPVTGVVGTHSTKSHPKVAAQSIHQKPGRPKTLMRDVVKRPGTTPVKTALKPRAKSAKHMDMLSTMPGVISEERRDRAKVTQKSQLVNRFAVLASPEKLVKRTAVLPVKKAPVDIIGHRSAPVLLTPEPPITPGDLFNNAMEKSTVHTARAGKSPKRRHKLAKKLGVSSKVFAVSTGMLAAVFLAGFFVIQNAPSASFRLAASRAGVRATLPGYKPSGFAMRGPIQSAPGEITISFRSNSDSRAFTVTQRSSSWNSSALLDNFVATATRSSYQALEAKGRTVYLYDKANATWVDGGVWYQIEGNSSLTPDQLLRIASSM